MTKAELLDPLRDKEYRDEFVSAHIHTGLAFQIRALRDQRNWSQQELGEKMGRKPAQAQPGVSALERPGHPFSLATLKKLASAFDVALVVRFEPFSALAAQVVQMRPGSLEVPSFEAELREASAETHAEEGAELEVTQTAASEHTIMTSVAVAGVSTVTQDIPATSQHTVVVASTLASFRQSGALLQTWSIGSTRRVVTISSESAVLTAANDNLALAS
jgi:transcriptional regulator with XRE-family HTH domain